MRFRKSNRFLPRPLAVGKGMRQGSKDLIPLMKRYFLIGSWKVYKMELTPTGKKKHSNQAFNKTIN
jgi:hypothetical protein